MIDFLYYMIKEELMRKVIEFFRENVVNGGGFFGVVIVKDGEIVVIGVNCVIVLCDFIVYVEVSVICVVVLKLGIFNLSGYEIYIFCEFCFMCLGVIYWV